MARVLALAASLGALALLAAGCGGGGGNGSRATKAWAGDLCSSIKTWQSSMADSVRSLRNMGLSRATLQSTADDVKGSTDAFVNELTGLGQPDTAAGAEAQDTVDTLATDLQGGVDDVETAVKSSSTTAGAITAVTNTLTTMGNELTSTLTQLGQLDAQGQIADAFKQAGSCKALVT
jgi:hypothetical protein